MAHEFPIKDIAFQAGLSTATVDRVINGRGGVRRQTEGRVRAALNELERQETGLAASGRKLAVDIVMEAPDRFTSEVRTAFESEAGAFFPVTFRSRFHFSEVSPHAELAQTLDRIRLRGSHGVVVKAPDAPVINAAVDRLEAAGIPVVTLVTDLPRTRRSAYAGMDNKAAGATAAYIIGRYLGEAPGAVLITLSSSGFRGEGEREAGFRQAMQGDFPDLGIVEISGGFGRSAATGSLALTALRTHPEIKAVYSIGGGNRAVLGAFNALGRTCEVYVAHDLDEENRDLMAQGALTFVLHHDLKADIRSVFKVFLEHHGILPKGGARGLSAIEVITPFNMPKR
jgi:LacI family transcriptional regulator